MKGTTKYGVLIFFALSLFILISQTGVFAVPPGVEGGNHTNMSIVAYPTNNTNSSVSWVDFNFTLNGSLESCYIEIGNQTGQQNLTGTVSPISATADACYVNATWHTETPAGLWYNASLWAFNDTHTGMIFSSIIEYKVDTETPALTIVGVTNHNNTYARDKMVQDTGISTLQDYLNVTWTTFDNTSSSTDNCKVEVLYETLGNKTTDPYRSKYSYTNFTGNITAQTAITSATRRYEALIPATSITDGIYQGKFWVKPYCTDATSHEGGTTTDNWAVVNPIPSNTWTPLGVMKLDTNLGTYINYSLSFDGNISYVASYQHDNASFITHSYHTYTSAETELINSTNRSSVYVFSTNGWTMLRMNDTSLDAPNNIVVYFNDTAGKARGNWRSFANFRQNTTKYIINNSATCGTAFTYMAWFNSSNTICQGGCWETYYNGFGRNNETSIPFGTNIWLITNTSNITITTYPSPLTVTGACRA